MLLKIIFLCLFFFIEEKVLNGLNYINVWLCCEINVVYKFEENVRIFGLNIVKKMGVFLEGNEIYVRFV